MYDWGMTVRARAWAWAWASPACRQSRHRKCHARQCTVLAAPDFADAFKVTFLTYGHTMGILASNQVRVRFFWQQATRTLINSFYENLENGITFGSYSTVQVRAVGYINPRHSYALILIHSFVLVLSKVSSPCLWLSLSIRPERRPERVNRSTTVLLP